MKNKNIVESFNNALQGIVQAVKKERNLKIHLVVGVIALFFCIVFRVSNIEFLIVFTISAIVIATELINTSIEAVIDLVCNDRFDPLAKLAKDVAAGAVFITAFTAAIIGISIFYDEFDSILRKKEYFIDFLPAELALISLLIVFILTLVLKIKKGSQSSVFHGGFPSGHSAVAFAAATIVLFISSSTIVIIIAYFLAFLVAQSRYEGKIHSLYEIIVGSLFGVLCIVVIYKLFLN